MPDKEEILKQYEYDVHYYGGGRKAILEAMDIYATQLREENKRLREALEKIDSEGYDPYDNDHHLVVQRWLKIATEALNNPIN